MKQFNGKELINARVDIDYSNKKPKVKFSYPDKKKQIQGNMKFWVITIWILIFLIFNFIYNMGIENSNFMYLSNNMTTYKTCTNHYLNDENYLTVIQKTCMKVALNNSLTYPMWDLTKGEILVRTNLWDLFKTLLIMFSILLIPPIIIYYLFKKKWDKYYPKFQSNTISKKIVIFKPKDVKNNYVEIPYFKNVLLDYKAEKDFAKYLLNVKIKEHNFKYYKSNKKHKINEWEWSARFNFKKKPRNGKLEVVFA